MFKSIPSPGLISMDSASRRLTINITRFPSVAEESGLGQGAPLIWGSSAGFAAIGNGFRGLPPKHGKT